MEDISHIQVGEAVGLRFPRPGGYVARVEGTVIAKNNRTLRVRWPGPQGEPKQTDFWLRGNRDSTKRPHDPYQGSVEAVLSAQVVAPKI